MVDVVAAELDRVHERIAGRFGRSEPRARVREYMSQLVRLVANGPWRGLVLSRNVPGTVPP